MNRRHRSGFTLIEVMLSATLMAVILAGAYGCFSAAVASEKLIDSRTEVFQKGRVALALIAADLRSACAINKDIALLGMRRSLGTVEADNLDFATHYYTPRRPHEGDFCEVSYFLDKDRETGQFALWRRRQPLFALEPLNGGRREPIVTGVAGLRFEYYDGWEWYNHWGEADTERPRARGNRTEPKRGASEASDTYGLPEAVRITLWLTPGSDRRRPSEGATNEPPLMFQTVARLNLASLFSGASASATSTPGNATPGGSPAGGKP